MQKNGFKSKFYKNKVTNSVDPDGDGRDPVLSGSTLFAHMQAIKKIYCLPTLYVFMENKKTIHTCRVKNALSVAKRAIWCQTWNDREQIIVFRQTTMV